MAYPVVKDPEVDDQDVADTNIQGQGDTNTGEAEGQDNIQEQDDPGTEQEPKEELSEELRAAILTLYENTRMEDETIRIQQLQKWRLLQLFWEGFQSLFWDFVARDWRTFSDLPEGENFDPDMDKIINIYRAHGESVIAALSINTPSTSFFPDDAENPDDVRTAQGFDAAVNLIEKHTDSKLLLIKCIQILWNQGTVAAYSYTKKDPKYGTLRVPIKETKEVPFYNLFCQSCGNRIATVKETKPVEPIQCANCGYTSVPELTEYTETIERIVDYKEEPKGRVEIELFGPLNVKIPYYAKRQADIGYLHLNLDKHYAMVKEQFRSPEDKDIYDKISGTPGRDTYERYMRLPPRYLGSIPQDLTVVNCVWFRPWMYNSLDEDIRDQLFEKFPSGLYAFIIDGDCVAEAYDECLDDKWTLSPALLSEYIHDDPIGKPLQDVQVLTNDMVNLTAQTIEYGIPETFADPKVLDFDKYGKSQAAPGMVTPARADAGKSLSDAFFTVKTASLSQEVGEFGSQLEEFGQFVTGDYPSVYGGSGGGSKTASEYQQSAARALQRLSLTWAKLTVFWSRLMSKCAVEFVEQMQEDERYVKKESGRFLNVWVRKTMMTGKIGHVEPESSEQLPQSWMQRRDQIMNLMKMQDPTLSSVLYSPENAEIMKQTFAMPDLFIPGEEDRLKQLDEIYEIISGIPVQIEEVDDHQVHMRIVKSYMMNLQGLELRKNNQPAYQALLQHYKEHMMAAQAMMAPAPPPVNNPKPSNGPNVQTPNPQ